MLCAWYCRLRYYKSSVNIDIDSDILYLAWSFIFDIGHLINRGVCMFLYLDNTRIIIQVLVNARLQIISF